MGSFGLAVLKNSFMFVWEKSHFFQKASFFSSLSLRDSSRCACHSGARSDFSQYSYRVRISSGSISHGIWNFSFKLSGVGPPGGFRFPFIRFGGGSHVGDGCGRTSVRQMLCVLPVWCGAHSMCAPVGTGVSTLGVCFLSHPSGV